MRDDEFAQLQLPVEIVEDDLLGDIYSDLSADSPEDWKPSSEWAEDEIRRRKSSRVMSSSDLSF
jgi:hypothetical protein